MAVIGDGAVGLCGVNAARRLGAEQIIILGRHADRIALAREFGATDVVSELGHELSGEVAAVGSSASKFNVDGWLMYQGRGGVNGTIGVAYGANTSQGSTSPPALARGFAVPGQSRQKIMVSLRRRSRL